MNDGSQIIFDLDGYEITPKIGVKQYVYLERDVLHNTINVVVADESGGQDTIPLAEIEENGNIRDRRRFASANIALSAEPKNIGITKHISRDSLGAGASFDVDIGFNGWEYIIFETGSSWGCIKLTDGSSTSSFPTKNTVLSPYSRLSSKGGIAVRSNRSRASSCQALSHAAAFLPSMPAIQ